MLVIFLPDLYYITKPAINQYFIFTPYTIYGTQCYCLHPTDNVHICGLGLGYFIPYATMHVPYLLARSNVIFFTEVYISRAAQWYYSSHTIKHPNNLHCASHIYPVGYTSVQVLCARQRIVRVL
jgi:hypothetical protein